MGKPKKTKEEVKEKRRLAALQRRERIKNDPILYQQSKEKEKERYNRRIRDKKILPICEMSPKNRKKAQKRNRENFRAYYKRQKEKEKLETIEEEVNVDIDVLDDNITDPLETVSTALDLNDSLASRLRSKTYTKREYLQNCAENPKSKEEDNQQHEICLQPISFEKELVPLKKTLNFKPNLITSTPRPSSTLSSSSIESMLSLSNNEQLTKNKDTNENIRVRATSLSSKRIVKKPKRKIISPSLLLRRYVYKTNKEMSYVREIIEKLKRAKEKSKTSADDDDSNQSDPGLEVDVEKFFNMDRSTSRARCDICQASVDVKGNSLMNHLKREHPKILKPGNDDSDAGEQDELYQEIVYLYDSDSKSPSNVRPIKVPSSTPMSSLQKHKAKLNSKSFKRPSISLENRKRRRTQDSTTSPPVDQFSEELENFGKYVTCLMKTVPEELCAQLQMDIINLIMTAKIKNMSRSDASTSLVQKSDNVPTETFDQPVIVSVDASKLDNASLPSPESNTAELKTVDKFD